MESAEFFSILRAEGITFRRLTVMSDIIGNSDIAVIADGPFETRLWPRDFDSVVELREEVRRISRRQ